MSVPGRSSHMLAILIFTLLHFRVLSTRELILELLIFVTSKPRISPGHKLHAITWRKCCLGHLRLCKNKHGWMGAILAFCRECLCHSSLGFRLSYSSHISQPQVSCLKCLLQRADNKSWHLPDQRGNRIYFKVTTLLSCNQNKSRIIK